MNIVKVTSSSQRKAFIDFPHSLYQDDPNYVPELFLTMKDLLNPRKNPYFKHSKATLYLAYNNGQIVGRIAATKNTEYNKFHNCNVGFFGFFDSINDPKVSEALLLEVKKYCKSEGLNKILGPCNFSTNETATLLIEGFDSPPVVQMTYNKKYYATLLEGAGYQKEMDFYAYWIATKSVNKKAVSLSNRLLERLGNKGIIVRNLNKADWKNELLKIRTIYKSAWKKNWGFVPPTNDEFAYIAADLKMIVDERYTFIAEHDGRPIGLIVGLPNINEVTIDLPKGRLFPFGIFKLLKGKSKCKSLRIFLLGVIDGYRKIGIEAVLMAELIKIAEVEGLLGGEASWVVDSNVEMKKSAEKLNGQPYKKYRIYSKNI